MPGPRLWKSLGHLVGLIALLGIASASLSYGQKASRPVAQQQLPETRDLFATDTIPFSAPPPLMVDSGIKCDPQGNIYLVYTDAPQAVLSQLDGDATLPISKLSLDSKAAVQYAVPSIPHHHHVLRYDFDVNARGVVYALLSTAYNASDKDKPRADYFLVRFKDDGTMDSYLKIGDIPGVHIQPIHFAAFPDGNFLVTGTAVEPRGLGTFTAVFDRGGNFAANIEVPDDVEVAPSNKIPQSAAAPGPTPTPPASSTQEGGQDHPPTREAQTKVPPPSAVGGGHAISAPDGNIYMLRATDPPRLYVVSPGGSVLREFRVTAPAPGLSPIQMAMVGDDKIFFQFAHIATGSPGETNDATRLITVVDPNSGQVTAVYRLAPTETGFRLAGCASSSYDFLFVGTSADNKKLEVVRYSPR